MLVYRRELHYVQFSVHLPSHYQDVSGKLGELKIGLVVAVSCSRVAGLILNMSFDTLS